MTFILTYNTLLTEIPLYLERNDTVVIDRIPTFISWTEERISREPNSILLLSYIAGNFTPGLNVYPKPGRWRRNISFIADNNDRPLQEGSYEFVNNYNNDTSQGVPLYYADYDYEHWIVAPTPDQAYPFQIGYSERPEPLSFTNQSNKITQYAPDLMFYGVLLESMGFLKNDERIPVWQTFYDRSLSSFDIQNKNRVFDRTAERKAI